MAGPGNSSFGDGDKNVSRPAESAPNRVGDANTPYTNKNGQDSLNVIRGQENHSYPDAGQAKSRELSPQAALQNELNHLVPEGDHHKYTVTLSRKNGGPYIDIKGGDSSSFENFHNNVQMNCSENFWNNINKLTANGQKLSLSVGGGEAQSKAQDHAPAQATEHPAMQKMEPKLDTSSKPAADAAKPKDTDSQIIDSKLSNLIPEGVHLKFTQNNGQFNFTPDKFVDPQHWAPIKHAIQSNPDLVNAIMHKMGSNTHLDIASGHKQETLPAKETHSTGTPEDGLFRLKTAENNLRGGAQTYGGAAQESYEPMYLGGHAFVNGVDVTLDPRYNKTIPANAQDGYPIDAKTVQGTSSIKQMQGHLHTEGNAKYFRVQRIVHNDGSIDQGQDLVDIPLTKQNKDGIASY